MNFLEVSEGGRLVKYIGRGRDDLEAASVRSNAPIAPSPLPLGYFEAQVLDAGRDGYMSIGMMNKRTPLDKLVGWAEGAIGYHGDDGNLFVGSGSGRAFGPLYRTGDIVGCGIDWINEHVFFTKNGRIVGSVKSPFSQEEEIYGAVGLRTPKETLRVNFGQSKFVFDMNQHLNELRLTTLSSKIDAFEPDHHKVLKLIIEYCLFGGYAKTLKSLLEYVGEDSKDYFNILEQRRKQIAVQDAIKTGQQIQDIVSDAYPDAKSDRMLLLHLQILDFTEHFFTNPQDLENVLKKADSIKERASQLDNKEKEELDKNVFNVLVYSNPSEANSAIQTRQYWRDTICEELEKYSCCKNTLLSAFKSIQEAVQVNKQGSVYSKRLWTLLDCAELWLPGFNDLQFSSK